MRMDCYPQLSPGKLIDGIESFNYCDFNWPVLSRMLGLFVVFSLAASNFDGDKADIPISYYSVVTPIHVDSELALASVEYQYPTGSKQQMTRGIKAPQLGEAFWAIFPPLNSSVPRNQGDPVRCGDRLRFRHLTTQVWLHAKKIPSQLNTGYEVSGSDSDQSENDWTIQCSEEEGPTLAVPVHIQNTAVGCYLSASIEAEYPATVAGHWEVFCDETADRNEWTLDKGIFVNPKVFTDDDPN